MDENKHTILVVDDNAILLRTMKSMLEYEYNVLLATSAAMAMTAIGRRKPDLIIMDYEMPVCNGKQALEMIRAEEELQNIPVIFLTGIADKDHIESVLSLKPAGYFLKPPDQDRLNMAITTILNGII